MEYEKYYPDRWNEEMSEKNEFKTDLGLNMNAVYESSMVIIKLLYRNYECN